MSARSDTSRLEAFSDGVFAIAITLLILEIKVPSKDAMHSPGDLWHALRNLWPSYFAFTYSFGTILVAWVNHHKAFKLVHRTSRSFMYANGFLLLTITFVPFPTALLAEYIATDYAQPAIVFFCFAGVLQNIGWNLVFESIRRNPDILHEGVTTATLDKLLTNTRFGLLIYTVTTILAWWFPVIALIINASLWILWISISLSEKNDW